MSTQITIRLPDDQVQFLDHLVSVGHASSRANAVATAIAREQHYRDVLHDIQRLQATGDDEDLANLADYLTNQPRPDLD